MNALFDLPEDLAQSLCQTGAPFPCDTLDAAQADALLDWMRSKADGANWKIFARAASLIGQQAAARRAAVLEETLQIDASGRNARRLGDAYGQF